MKPSVKRLVQNALRLVPSRHRIRLMRALKGRDQRRRIERADVVIVSFPKSGRTWFRLMLSRCYAESFGLDRNALLKDDSFNVHEPRIPRVMFFHGSFLEEVASGRDPRTLFADKKVIFLTRNPIDTSISCYFHILGGRTDPDKREMKGIPDSLEGTSIAEFTSNSRWSVLEIVRFMNGWHELLKDHPRQLTISYEAMRSDSLQEMERVNAFLGSPFTPQAMDAAVAASTFEQLKEQERKGTFANSALRPRNSEDPNSYKVRRGKVGGYVDYLEPAKIREFEGYISQNLAPTFGYFQD